MLAKTTIQLGSHLETQNPIPCLLPPTKGIVCGSVLHSPLFERIPFGLCPNVILPQSATILLLLNSFVESPAV